jgi:hypothetical protein
LINPNKPKLIIAGVNKAATTSLFMYLSAHPQICASHVKETQYFLPIRYGAKELPPVEYYWDYFSHCKQSDYILEATAGYFYGGSSIAKAIEKTLGRIRIIFIFREPVARMFSFFKFRKNMLELDESLSFSEYIQLCETLPPSDRVKRENNAYWGIEGGYYSNYLSDWFEVFGEQNIRIIFFEHFVNDPRSEIADLCQWLDLEYDRYIAKLDTSVENRTRSFNNRFLQRIALQLNWKGESFWRSHPRIKKNLRRLYYALNKGVNQDTITEDDRAYLETIFRPYNNRLAKELDQRGYSDLPEWLVNELLPDPTGESDRQFDRDLIGE